MADYREQLLCQNALILMKGRFDNSLHSHQAVVNKRGYMCIWKGPWTLSDCKANAKLSFDVWFQDTQSEICNVIHLNITDSMQTDKFPTEKAWSVIQFIYFSAIMLYNFLALLCSAYLLKLNNQRHSFFMKIKKCKFFAKCVIR